MTRSRSHVVLGSLSVALVAGLAWFSCTGGRSLTAPGNHQPSLSFQGQQQDLAPALAAKDRYTERLLAVPRRRGHGGGSYAGRPPCR